MGWLADAAAAVEAMVPSTGLRVVSRPRHETWLCERAHPSAHRAELDAATARR